MAPRSVTADGLYVGAACTGDARGIAVALVEAGGPRPQVRVFETIPLAAELGQRLAALTRGNVSLEELAAVDLRLGELFGDAIASVLAKQHTAGATLRGIGLERFVLRRLQADGAALVACGAAAPVALRFTCPVVSDFAAADMAAGGAGAPLASVFLRDFFARTGKGIAVHEINAAASVTYIDPIGGCPLAFDTGPGTGLVDLLARKHFGKPGDADGTLAAQGQVNAPFLEELLHDDYFERVPPKTAGERFGDVFAKRFEKRAKWWGLTNEDRLATATALTARTMAEAYRRFVIPHGRVDEVVLCGPGARSAFLRVRLAEDLNGIKLSRSDEHGLDFEAVTSSNAAYLAFRRLSGLFGNLPHATGARREVILGAVLHP